LFLVQQFKALFGFCRSEACLRKRQI
jgi:hypothetical protein